MVHKSIPVLEDGSPNVPRKFISQVTIDEDGEASLTIDVPFGLAIYDIALFCQNSVVDFAATTSGMPILSASGVASIYASPCVQLRDNTNTPVAQFTQLASWGSVEFAFTNGVEDDVVSVIIIAGPRVF